MDKITQLTKEKMDIMKELAAANLKVSETQNVIFKLKEEEKDYLTIRERAAMERVEMVLDESKELLANTHKNYEEIHSICGSITNISNFVSETYDKVHSLLEDINKRSDKWDKEVERQQKEFEEIRKRIIADKAIIANDKKTIEKANEEIEKEKAHIESRQAQIKVALQLLEKKQKQYE